MPRLLRPRVARRPSVPARRPALPAASARSSPHGAPGPQRERDLAAALPSNRAGLTAGRPPPGYLTTGWGSQVRPFPLLALRSGWVLLASHLATGWVRRGRGPVGFLAMGRVGSPPYLPAMGRVGSPPYLALQVQHVDGAGGHGDRVKSGSGRGRQRRQRCRPLSKAGHSLQQVAFTSGPGSRTPTVMSGPGEMAWNAQAQGGVCAGAVRPRRSYCPPPPQAPGRPEGRGGAGGRGAFPLPGPPQWAELNEIPVAERS